jgi:hypothetical protein
MTAAMAAASSNLETVMLSLVVSRCSLVGLLASLCACGSSPPPPDASPIPTRIDGTFALTSSFAIDVPPAAASAIGVLTAASDGPDDPARYLIDQMIAAAPDGSWKSLAADAAPVLAAYLNDELRQLAPKLSPGLAAIAGGTARIASRIDTTETLVIDPRGGAIRTITGARFSVGEAVTEVSFADAGLPDIAVELTAGLDGSGQLVLGPHAHAWPYGALLRLGLDRAVIPSVEPSAHDLAGALAALLDCDGLGELVADELGAGSPALYASACRAALTAAAGEVYAQLGAIDEVPISLAVAGSATAIDLDGDGRMDELDGGRWTGTLDAAAAHQPLTAAVFTGHAAASTEYAASGAK